MDIEKLLVNFSSDTDPNAEFIAGNVYCNDDNMYTLSHVFACDDNGNYSLDMNILSDAEEVFVYEPIIISVDNVTEKYSVFSHNDILMIFDLQFVASEFKASADKAAVELSKLRKSLLELSSGYEPYANTTFSFIQGSGYTALAGNPIYVNVEETSGLINNFSKTDQTIEKNNGLFVLCHEMSHTFDFLEEGKAAGYCFDRELFATLKALYALHDNGYTISESLLSDSPPLASGIYNYEVLIRRFVDELELLDGGDWQCIADTMSELRNDTELIDGSDKDRFDRFVTVLSEKSGKNIYDIFSESELKTLNMNFEY